MSKEAEYIRPERQELENVMIRFMTKGNCRSMDDAGTVLQDQVRRTVDYLCKQEMMLHHNAVRRSHEISENSRKVNDIIRQDLERRVSLYVSKQIGCICTFSDDPDLIQIRLKLMFETTGYFSNLADRETSGIFWIYENNY